MFKIYDILKELKFDVVTAKKFYLSQSDENFILEIMSPMSFANDQTVENITLKLNQLLEKMIMKNPHQWIWSHNRWK